MGRRIRYYLWNKIADFDTGYGENVRYSDDGLYMKDTDVYTGIYFSEVIDSGEKNKHWSKAEVLMTLCPNASVTVTFYVSDKSEILHNGSVISVGDILADESFTAEQKESLCKEIAETRVFRNVQDIMLTKLYGRYIWYSIRIQCGSPEKPYISRIRIWHDHFDWLAYLPEVYQHDSAGADFTARYLGIFQNIYEEMQEKIRTIPASYDISHADRDFLDWLSEWTGISDSGLWSDSQLRELLKRATDLYRRTGTPGMIADMAEIYTGVRPVILENYFAPDAKSAVRAWKSGEYEKEPFSFTVLMPGEAVRTETEHRALMQILLQSKPAHMRMQLIFINTEPGSSSPEGICLDGRTALTQGGRK